VESQYTDAAAASPVWSRAYLRGLRDALASEGLTRCPTCKADSRGRRGPEPQRRGEGIGFDSGPHPLDWMSINSKPALVWHGTPTDGELAMYVSTSCRYCYAVLLFDSCATWSADHPGLTTLTDEQQVARDGR
jgi:hypothetical protein